MHYFKLEVICNILMSWPLRVNNYTHASKRSAYSHENTIADKGINPVTSIIL